MKVLVDRNKLEEIGQLLKDIIAVNKATARPADTIMKMETQLDKIRKVAARTYKAIEDIDKLNEMAMPLSYGWLVACDEELVSAHLGVAELSDSYDTAKRKLKELIDWHIAVAIDPKVNGGYCLVYQPVQQEPKCSTHPKAPHGFDRNGSHNAGRYVCECEGWDAYSAGYQAGVEATPVQQEPQ